MRTTITKKLNPPVHASLIIGTTGGEVLERLDITPWLASRTPDKLRALEGNYLDDEETAEQVVTVLCEQDESFAELIARIPFDTPLMLEVNQAELSAWRREHTHQHIGDTL